MTAKKKEPGDKITIEHHRARNFDSHFATGVMLSGPLSFGITQLTFFADVRRINSEHGEVIEVGEDTASIKLDDARIDTTDFREDVCRILMPPIVSKQLYELLKKRYEPADSE